MMNIHEIAYYAGIAIVVGSHGYMLLNNMGSKSHSIWNLFAASLIAYYFMWKQNFITF
jgi:hypothetical protein